MTPTPKPARNYARTRARAQPDGTAMAKRLSDDVRIEVVDALIPNRRKEAALVKVALGPVTLWVEVVRRRFGVLALRYPHGPRGAPGAHVSADLARRITDAAAPHLASGR
ncbi:hypothetical protein [Falsiroseomonas oryziterrae]|uniref:hypothetical protein n=1 Tax=Falsiroseomonas oryziterrae TaxID=2911368 RepID=UPI001F47B70C|nr:hypothetical protein [Roseomonas sp. NPKOSM-4]